MMTDPDCPHVDIDIETPPSFFTSDLNKKFQISKNSVIRHPLGGQIRKNPRYE